MRSFFAAVAFAVLVVPLGPVSAQAPAPGVPVAPQPPPIAAAQAAGAGATKPVYLTARVGAFVPQGEDLKDFDFGTAVDFEVGVGMQFTPALAGEFSIGRFSTSGKGTLTYFEGGGTTVEAFEGDLEVMSFTATLKAFAPIEGPLKLYGLGGVGMYNAELSGKSAWMWTDGYYTEFGEESGSESDSPLGLHLGAGVTVPVSAQARLGVEAKYAFVSPEFFGQTFKAGGFRVAGALAFQF